MTRPGHLDQIGVTGEEMNQVLDALAAVVEPVILRFYWRPQLKDPNDEMVLETAVNGGADRRATFNIKHLAVAARTFGIRSARPGSSGEKSKGAEHEKK